MSSHAHRGFRSKNGGTNLHKSVLFKRLSPAGIVKRLLSLPFFSLLAMKKLFSYLYILL